MTTILGAGEVFLSKGSTLNLTCVVSRGPARQPFIIWTHNSKVSRTGLAPARFEFPASEVCAAADIEEGKGQQGMEADFNEYQLGT